MLQIVGIVIGILLIYIGIRIPPQFKTEWKEYAYTNFQKVAKIMGSLFIAGSVIVLLFLITLGYGDSYFGYIINLLPIIIIALLIISFLSTLIYTILKLIEDEVIKRKKYRRRGILSFMIFGILS
jgi:uncharacterized membrane protein